VNEAALLAARANRRFVAMVDFEAAKDKVMMGAERRSMVMTDDEKRLTAYHEAGHALVGLLVAGNDPLHKVTIIPRGRALGVTMNLPERDRVAMRKSEIEARLAMTFGGRIAEEIIFGPGEVTTGASNDIQQATALARRMVTEWGMSDKLGRLRYSDNEEQVFLGRSIGQSRNVSDDTAKLIDSEVRRIIEEAEGRAREALTVNMAGLHAVAEALLTYETLSGAEVQAVLDGEPVVRPEPQAPAPPATRGSVPPTGAAPRPVPVASEPRLQPQG
jgi:cell division protease FtsH